MDIRKLCEADRYLLYGLLLRKKRPPEAELRVMEIMRSQVSLDDKIEAILKVQRKLPGGEANEAESLLGRAAEAPPASRRPARKHKQAVVADLHPEVTRLLNKSSSRWGLEFTQAESEKQALYLVRKLRARLLIGNLGQTAEKQEGFFRECRERQPRLKAIFLCTEDCPAPTPDVFYLPKPISVPGIEEAVRKLLPAG
jgi:CheY-like chemotaxis protein